MDTKMIDALSKYLSLLKYNSNYNVINKWGKLYRFLDGKNILPPIMCDQFDQD